MRRPQSSESMESCGCFQLGARLENVFNCDETVIILRAHPKRTLAQTSVKGTKHDMDCLTFLLSWNVRRTEGVFDVGYTEMR